MKNEAFITSGIYKGRKIRTPGGGTHPMGAREKLALFNAISEYLPGSTVLDAYAGSGALGIEALSRGAKNVTFVEKNAAAARIIRENLQSLNLEGEVLQKDATNLTDTTKYDVVLADPPYDGYKPEMIENLANLVADGGILVVSTPEIPPVLPGFELKKSKKYARALISVYYKA